MENSNNIHAILVMNAHHARLFYYQEGPVYHKDYKDSSLQDFKEKEDFVYSKNVLSDSKESFDGMGDRDNADREYELEKFTKKVADALFEHFKIHEFEDLILIAPAKITHSFKTHLHTDLQNKLNRIAYHNIVNLTAPEIYKYLQKEIDL